MDALVDITDRDPHSAEGMLGWREFRASPIAVIALALIALLIALAFLAPWIAPQILMISRRYPSWTTSCRPARMGSRGSSTCWAPTIRAATCYPLLSTVCA